MGIDERIQEEMYVPTESLLEDEFDRTKTLYDIYENNTVIFNRPVPRCQEQRIGSHPSHRMSIHR